MISRYSRTLVAASFVQDHRIEFVVVQLSSSAQNLPDGDHQVVPFSTPRPAEEATELATTPAGRLGSRQKVRVRRYAASDVAVVVVSGPLGEVVDKVDLAIQVALTERARGVVCDLSAVVEGVAQTKAVELLATAGRHVSVWPGAPVAVACPDQKIREALRANPLGRHLIVTESLLSAMTAVLATRTLTVERLRIHDQVCAPQESTDFVRRNLRSWRLGPVIPVANLVIGELVANSVVDASSDMELSIVWNLGALRLAVRDGSPDLLKRPLSHLDPHRRPMSVVAVLSRAHGVLPTADGGRVVWAVLEAPKARPRKPAHAA